MIIRSERIHGTPFHLREYDDGTVLYSRPIYLDPAHWDQIRKLAMFHDKSTSQMIGKLVEQAIAAMKETITA